MRSMASRRARACTRSLWPSFEAPPAAGHLRMRFESSIQRIVLRQTVLQVLHDRVGIVARLFGVLGPFGIERLGRLAPLGELFGGQRVELVAGLRLDLVASAGLELGPWHRDPLGPFRRAVIV